jgi:hypothetical protein
MDNGRYECVNSGTDLFIRRVIPRGWSVTTSNATVRIRSERDVTLIGRISRPAMPGGMEQLAREFGHTTKYQVPAFALAPSPLARPARGHGGHFTALFLDFRPDAQFSIIMR